MENHYKGSVTIEIAGGSFEVAYTWDAIARLSSSLGADFDAKLTDAIDKVDVDTLATALAIGIGKPEVTPEWIKEHSPAITEVTHAVLTALQIAYLGPEAVRKMREADASGDRERPNPPNPFVTVLKRALFWRGASA